MYYKIHELSRHSFIATWSIPVVVTDECFINCPKVDGLGTVHGICQSAGEASSV